MIKGWSSVTYLRKQTWFDGFHNTWWSSDGQAMVKRWSNNVGAQISFTAILMWNFKTETKERIAGGKSGNNSLSFELAREKVYHHFMTLVHDHGSVKEAKEDGARIWRQTLSWTVDTEVVFLSNSRCLSSNRPGIRVNIGHPRKPSFETFGSNSFLRNREIRKKVILCRFFKRDDISWSKCTWDHPSSRHEPLKWEI